MKKENVFIQSNKYLNMKIFADSTGTDLIIILLNNENKIVDFIWDKNLLKKVEKIPQNFQDLLIKNQVKIQDIKTIYLNIGPGTFTGSRISLVFFRTIAQIHFIDFFTINSFEIINQQTKDQKIFIDAKGNKLYCGEFNQQNKLINISIAEKDQQKINAINYSKIIENFSEYLHLFKENKNLLEVEALYIKKPQIGSIK